MFMTKTLTMNKRAVSMSAETQGTGTVQPRARPGWQKVHLYPLPPALSRPPGAVNQTLHTPGGGGAVHQTPASAVGRRCGGQLLPVGAPRGAPTVLIRTSGPHGVDKAYLATSVVPTCLQRPMDGHIAAKGQG